MKTLFEKLKTLLKKPWIIVVIIVVAVVAIYFFMVSGNKSSYEFAEARLGDVSQEVSVTGKVKPAESVDLAFEKSGKISSIAINIGDKVVAGQILASLSSSDLVAQLAQAQASLDKEIIKLAELKVGTRNEEIQIAQTNVTSAQNSLTNAQNSLVNVGNKAVVDLDNYYEDVKDILNEAYLKADDAVNKQTDELFSNDNSDSPSLTF
jgi:multidrug efflux pump subunit AcrA (membrane-fusion protein)